MSEKGVSNRGDYSDLSRILPLLDNKDSQLLGNVMDYLTSKYPDALNELPIQIPISCMNRELTAFQFVVKYLRENLNLKTKTIAENLKRNPATISLTYRKAMHNFSEKIKPKSSKLDIPIQKLNRKGSVLESFVVYLIEDQKLTFSEIGKVLKRDERTIWTTYDRYKKKTKLSGGSSR